MSMIIGTHAAIHSADAAKDVELLRDVLQLDAVDAGAAVIFRLPLAEVHAHPFEQGGAIEFYLMCRDIEESYAAWARTASPVARSRMSAAA
jgi:hypothetical protein